MSIRFHYHKCKPFGVTAVEAKCLRYIAAHHPAPDKARRAFQTMPERLQRAGLATAQSGNQPDAYWRLTKKGAALLRRLAAAHGPVS